MKTFHMPQGYKIPPPSPVAEQSAGTNDQGDSMVRIRYEGGEVLDIVVKADGSIQIETNCDVAFDEAAKSARLILLAAG